MLSYAHIFIRFAKPISVARRVLEDPSLSMVVGGGATLYAEQKGFALEDNDKLLTQHTALAYQVCVGVGGGGGGGFEFCSK